MSEGTATSFIGRGGFVRGRRQCQRSLEGTAASFVGGSSGIYCCQRWLWSTEAAVLAIGRGSRFGCQRSWLQLLSEAAVSVTGGGSGIFCRQRRLWLSEEAIDSFIVIGCDFICWRRQLWPLEARLHLLEDEASVVVRCGFIRCSSGFT